MSAPSEFWRDPALPFVESRRACHSRACYRPHSHPTFSIGAVDEGRSLFSDAAEAAVELSAGTLVFVPAGRVHACNPAPGEAWSYQMLHLAADWHRAAREVGPLTPATPSLRIVREPLLYQRFCRLNALLFSRAAAQEKEAALIEFINECETHEGWQVPPPLAPATLAAQLEPLLDFLRSEDAVGVDLEALAQRAGMSRYQLIRAFRAVTGLTPHAWQLNQQVNRARDAVRAGEALADLALRLGFADQAHFQRVFKAHAGTTPGRYRR